MYTWTFQRVPWMVPVQGVNFSIFLGSSVTSWKVHRYILCYLCLFFFHGLDVTSDTFVVGEGQNHSDGGQSGTARAPGSSIGKGQKEYESERSMT